MPAFSVSLSCVPCSAIFPLSITNIVSASLIVLSLWAITIVVRPLAISLSDFLIRSSVSLSTEDVASSSMRILGFLYMALAMHILCFCPTDSFWPLSPSCVSYPSGSLLANSFIWHSLTASSNLSVSMLSTFLGYIIFSLIVPSNINPS